MHMPIAGSHLRISFVYIFQGMRRFLSLPSILSHSADWEDGWLVPSYPATNWNVVAQIDRNTGAIT